jgi:hypothetical protein
MKTETEKELTLKVGRIYRAKKPKGFGFPRLCDDRQIVHLSSMNVQYDSPSVPRGRKYPVVTIEKFREWASHDVTESLPEGDWQEFPPPPMTHVVQRWSQYKLGNADFTHDVDADIMFTSEESAEAYVLKANSGASGDTRHRYEIVPISK